MPTLTLVRGLPGSGKSTYAQSLGIRNHCEADQFFVTDALGYNFDPTKLKQAHAWCQERTAKALSRGEDAVVANTFTTEWEIKVYVDMARDAGARLRIVTMTGDYGSIHGVPDDAIERMRSRFLGQDELEQIFPDAELLLIEPEFHGE